MKIFYFYLTLINIISFIVMCVDKHRASNHRWRIPERILFLLAALGGSIGSIAGMWIVRHKTRHWYFVVGMPFILAVQVLICVMILH